MTIEEAGPAGPKVLRLLYFVGAGFITVVTINKWKELERKSIQKQQQNDLLSQSSQNTLRKAIKKPRGGKNVAGRNYIALS